MIWNIQYEFFVVLFIPYPYGYNNERLSDACGHLQENVPTHGITYLAVFSKCNSFNLFLHKTSSEKHLSVFSNYVVGTSDLCFRKMKYTPFCGKMYMFGGRNSTLCSAICGILRCNMPHITMQNTALYILKCRVLYAVKPHLAAHLCSV